MSSLPGSEAPMLYVHPALGGFIATLDLPEQPKSKSASVALSSGSSSPNGPASADGITTIILLDQSGSMGQSVSRLVRTVIPAALEEMGVPPFEKVPLITFESSSKIYEMTRAEMWNSTMTAAGGTYMHYGIENVKAWLTKQGDSIKALRILSISDGELNDDSMAMASSATLRQFLSTKAYPVNSQAVRLFTSSSQPSTKGLASMMQLSSGVDASASLVDVSAQSNLLAMASLFASLFVHDGLGSLQCLTSTTPILQSTPWRAGQTTLAVSPGKNVFWLTGLPDDNAKLKLKDGREVKFELREALSTANYHTLLSSKIDLYMQQLKVLKVVGTEDARKEISEIVGYFTSLDNAVAGSAAEMVALLKNPSLRSRIEYFKAVVQRTAKSTSAMMSQIANDDRVSKMNSAQSAEYLRSYDSSRNSKAMARRMLKVDEDVDFTGVAREEAKAMAAHLDELKEVDDSSHTVSFYSQSTTLEGIKTICELVADGTIDCLDVNDIMRALNLVGVACHAPIGEYPDPMSYRLDKIYSGCYVSLADVLTGLLAGGGTPLTVPGSQNGETIVNVLPFFDDVRIHMFLRKYAPKLLEYTAGVGMRRAVGAIPMTMGYTLLAGVWKLIEELDTNRSELQLKTFTLLVQTAKRAIGGYFAHVEPLLIDQQPRSLSYYIGGNGTTNMLLPLLSIVNSPEKQDLLPRILRALYTFEVWQMVRKSYRHKEQADVILKNMLHKLLSLDLANSSKKTPRQPLFTPEPPVETLVFNSEYEVDEATLSQHVKSFWFVDYVAQLPAFLKAASMPADEGAAAAQFAAYRSIPSKSDATVAKALGVMYDWRMFQFYNVMQALIYTEKQERVKEKEEAVAAVPGGVGASSSSSSSSSSSASPLPGQSLLPDLVDPAVGAAMVRSYVSSQYRAQYESEVLLKRKDEESALLSELLTSFYEAPDRATLVKLFQEGLTRGDTTVKLLNSGSDGFTDLKDKVLDINFPVRARRNLAELMLLGRDGSGDDAVHVWNGGNTLRFTEGLQGLDTFAFLFLPADEARWNALKNSYLKRAIHMYRLSQPNRQGHSNDKPSYWALGFRDLEEMQKAQPVEFEAYCKVHASCCGMGKKLKLSERRKMKRGLMAAP